MPLIKSGSRAAIGENIREMQAAGHPHNQAVAAALHTADQYSRKAAAGGGFQAPYGGRGIERHALASGFLHSNVPGRTDKLPITVGGGAYVLPADHVAALGQGNSLAGANIVNKMFKMGPYGTQMGGLHAAGAKQPHLKLGKAKGGAAHHPGPPTPIIAAGGEIIIPPDKIIAKWGDLDHGHKALDQWVIRTRKKHIKQLKGLKPPRKD